MRTVNVKELKARLSAYLREAGRGEVFLVTDHGTVVARLSGAAEGKDATPQEAGVLSRLAALGARLPLRERRPTDYRRRGPPAGLTTQQIDALLNDVRGER